MPDKEKDSDRKIRDLASEIVNELLKTGEPTRVDISTSGVAASGTDTSTEINGVSGDVIGPNTSGMGNIMGKDIAYSVAGNVINIHVNNDSAEILRILNAIISQPTQLETSLLTNQIDNINTELNNVKANEAKGTKEAAGQLLKDIDEIGKERGVRIDQIRVEELQVSRNDLRYWLSKLSSVVC